MLFITPKQIKTLARLNNKDVESLVLETHESSVLIGTFWGLNGKPRQYTIDADGKYREVKQNA